MKIITYKMIENLKLDPNVWYEWANEVLLNKHLFTMPAKTSLHFGTSYFNTMPSILPSENIMGVKVVNRYLGRIPSLDSQLLLYDYTTGENIALMDANLITAMRTGAVTVHSMELLANPDFYEIGIMGFGNIGIACMEILLSHFSAKPMIIKLLRYKDHANKVYDRYKKFKNVKFIIVDSVESIIRNSDVIISCITYTEELIGRNDWYKVGCLVIPVHLRGFQNCDLFFDKVYGDDYDQVKGFKYFDQFKFFAETSEVLRGEKVGRENSREKILAYNVGMSIHDIYAAFQVFKHFERFPAVERMGPNKQYWL